MRTLSRAALAWREYLLTHDELQRWALASLRHNSRRDYAVADFIDKLRLNGTAKRAEYQDMPAIGKTAIGDALASILKTELRPVRVTLDDGADDEWSVPAYATTERWNGFIVPALPLESMRTLAARMPDMLTVNADETVTYHDPDDDSRGHVVMRPIDCYVVDMAGQTLSLPLYVFSGWCFYLA